MLAQTELLCGFDKIGGWTMLLLEASLLEWKVGKVNLQLSLSRCLDQVALRNR